MEQMLFAILMPTPASPTGIAYFFTEGGQNAIMPDPNIAESPVRFIVEVIFSAVVP